jgi:hypothetical protein
LWHCDAGASLYVRTDTTLSGLVNVIIIYLGARLILTDQGFSVGMRSWPINVRLCGDGYRFTGGTQTDIS